MSVYYTWEESIQVLLCTLEASIHTLLYMRHLYPRSLFTTVRLWNVAVQQSRHPRLNAYLHRCLENVQRDMQQGRVEKLVVGIHPASDGERNGLLERFVFSFQPVQLIKVEEVSGKLKTTDRLALELEMRSLLLRCCSVLRSMDAPSWMSNSGDAVECVEMESDRSEQEITWSLAIKTSVPPLLDQQQQQHLQHTTRMAHVFPADHSPTTERFHEANAQQWIPYSRVPAKQQAVKRWIPIHSSDLNGLFRWSLHVEVFQ